MKFFTDKTVDNDYLLIKIGDYLKFNLKRSYKEIFVDPGVYDLTKSDKFSWEGKIDIPSFLDGLPDNHYFSFDYPCDMNPKYQDEFILKTWDNANKYCNHPNYIVTAQYPFNNYWCFTTWFDRYNQLPIESGIMGLGNLCRIMHLSEYMKHALGYAFKNCRHPRIHIYGLAKRNIKYAYRLARKYGIKLSIDSTKWTRGSTALQCRVGHAAVKSGERQLFFDTYIEELRERGIEIE